MKSSTTRERLTATLARIDDPIGEGARTRLPSIATARAPRPRPPNALPTTPMVAPTIAEMTSPDVFARKNAPLLRNYLDGQFLRFVRHLATTAACGRIAHRPSCSPRNGHDRQLFRIAAAIERFVRRLSRDFGRPCKRPGETA